MKPLWPHQLRYLHAAREAYRKGYRSLLLCMPTGAGKTILSTAICQSHFGKGGRILWTVAGIELVEQAAAALREAEIPCGIITPNHPRTWEATQVASVDTLSARDLVLPGISLMVWDEARHCVAPSYIKVRRQYPDALLIGLDATPCRQDGIGLGVAFQHLIAEVQPQELIDGGFLVPCRVLVPEGGASRSLADFQVDAYRKHCDGRQAISFCASVKDAEEQAHAFALAGYPARNVDGTTPADVRAAAIADFRAGRLRVLTNYMVLTEGVDLPGTSCIILGRRVHSEAALIQMTGRGLRIAPNKSDCIVLDLAGSCCDLHMLPTSPRKYSLEGRGVSAVRDELIRVTQCPACGAVFEAHVFKGGVCPVCHWRKPGKPDPRVKAQRMIELREARLATEAGKAKVEFLRQMLVYCRTQRKKDGTPYKPEYASRMFAEKFHRYPNRQEMTAAGWPSGIVEEGRGAA